MPLYDNPVPPQRPALVSAAVRRATKKPKKARLADFNPQAPTSKAFPGQQPMDNPWMTALLRDGVKFWGDRGVTINNPQLDWADDLETVSARPEGVQGRGWKPGQSNDNTARVALNRQFVQGYLDEANDRSARVVDRRAAMKKLAALLYHEMGHAGGVDHSDKGLMAASGDLGQPDDYTKIPYSSVAIIRKLIPKQKRLKAKGRQTYRGVG